MKCTFSLFKLNKEQKRRLLPSPPAAKMLFLLHSHRDCFGFGKGISRQRLGPITRDRPLSCQSFRFTVSEIGYSNNTADILQLGLLKLTYILVTRSRSPPKIYEVKRADLNSLVVLSQFFFHEIGNNTAATIFNCPSFKKITKLTRPRIFKLNY